MLTAKYIYLIGREKVKKGPQKGQFIEVTKRKILLNQIVKVSLSTRQDDIFVIHVENDYGSVLESTFKTELLSILSKRYKELSHRDLQIEFTDQISFLVKKEGFMGAGNKIMKFVQGRSDQMQINSSLVVAIGAGLPKNSRPGVREKVDTKIVPGHINVVSNGAAEGGRGAAPKSRSQQPRPFAPAPGGASHAAYGIVNKAPGGGRPPAPRHPAPGPPRANGPGVRMAAPQLPRGAPPGSGRPRAPVPNQSSVPALDPGRAGEKRKSMERSTPGPRPPLTEKPRPKPKTMVRAIYAYEAQETDELSFNEGDRIELIAENASGWWKGRFRGREGVFPSNYVEKE